MPRCSQQDVSGNSEESDASGDTRTQRDVPIFARVRSVSILQVVPSFNWLSYIPFPTGVSCEWVDTLTGQCSMASGTVLHPFSQCSAPNTLALHNHVPETIGALKDVMHHVRRIVISIQTPHLAEIIEALVTVKNQLKELQHLIIANNRIATKSRRPLLKLLGGLTHLKVLVLDNCGLYDTDVEAICAAISWTAITHLSVNGNKLSFSSLRHILTALRDHRACAPINLFVGHLDAEGLDFNCTNFIRTFRLYSDAASAKSSARSNLTPRTGMILNVERKEKGRWHIPQEVLFLDLAKLEVIDAVAPDLGLFIYRWLQMARATSGNVQRVVIRLNGRVISTIQGISKTLSMYGMYMLFYQSLSTIGLPIALDLTNCSLEFDVRKLRIPLDVIPFLMQRLSANVAGSLVALSLSDCDLCERWRHRDIVELMSFLRACKQLRRLDLRYNEFNKEFSTQFCEELANTEFLPLLDILEADMLIDLQALAISLQARYSEYVLRAVEDRTAMCSGLTFRGPRNISCGSQSRGTKLSGALMRMLTVDGSLLISSSKCCDIISSARKQKIVSAFDTYGSILQDNVLSDVLRSPLQVITCRQTISAGSLAKASRTDFWQYADAELSRAEAQAVESVVDDSISLAEAAHRLAYIAAQRAVRSEHPIAELWLRKVENKMLTLREFLEFTREGAGLFAQPELKYINLTHNPLNKVDVTELVQVVSLLPTIQAVSIAGCALSDRACGDFILAIPQILSHTRLFYINMSDNSIGDVSMQALCTVLPDILACNRPVKQVLISMQTKATRAFQVRPEKLLSAFKTAVPSPSDTHEASTPHPAVNTNVWLVLSKDREGGIAVDESVLQQLRSHGIHILTTVIPSGKFYDHHFVDATPVLLRELGLPDYSFEWNCASSIWEHFIYNCA